MGQDFTGYPVELERRAELQASSIEFMSSVKGLFAAPKSFDPRGWMRTENQGNVGRCAGYGSSTVAELCYWIASHDVTQFSGHYSYIRAQGLDGMLGRDNGSTIAGNVAAAKQFGFCPQDKFGQEPASYTPRLPDNADQDAAPFKVRSSSMLRTVDEIDTYLKAGLGGVLVGAAWGGWGPDANGYVRSFRGGGGGHAWAILGWLEDGARLMLNSHGSGWGKLGWAYLTDAFLEQMLRDSWTVAAGLSDLTTPKPRPVDWTIEGTFR